MEFDYKENKVLTKKKKKWPLLWWSSKKKCSSKYRAYRVRIEYASLDDVIIHDRLCNNNN